MTGKHIPNSITSLNLVSGFVSVVFALEGNYQIAAYLILLAAVFDFLDGFAARLLKAYSDIGKELDSLADVVSFGVAPGMIIFGLLKELCLNAGYPVWISWIAVLIPVFSALRLAKFNIDTRQTNSFLGLPTPANALFWAFGLAFTSDKLVDSSVFPFVIIVAVIIFSWLLVCEVPMFSLKFKSFGLKQNLLQYIFLACCLVLVIIFGMSGIAACILLYVFMSVFSK